MPTETGESCASNYLDHYSCDFVTRKKDTDLDIIKKEVENKELKLVELEERIKLLKERQDLEDKILELEKQASLLVNRKDIKDVQGDKEPCPSSSCKTTEKANEVVKESSWNDFMVWRRSHPGPKTKRAYQFWLSNGCKDLPGFAWGRRKLYQKKRNGEKKSIINNFY